jgi:hypothetical protein
MATEIAFEIEADPVIDVLVSDPEGKPQRLIIHRGRLALFEIDPSVFRRRRIGMTIDHALWLPDGFGYRQPPTIASANMATAQMYAPQEGGYQAGLAGWTASAEPDPRGTGLWFVQLWVSAYIDTRPALFSYTVHVLADPACIEPGA